MIISQAESFVKRVDEHLSFCFGQTKLLISMYIPLIEAAAMEGGYHISSVSTCPSFSVIFEDGSLVDFKHIDYDDGQPIVELQILPSGSIH